MRRGFIALAVLGATFATAAAFSQVSPAAPLGRTGRAPRTAAAATKLVRKDVQTVAGNYAHKRYRTVCTDLAASARSRLGGNSRCIVKVAALQLLLPIKTLTIVKVTLRKHNAQAVVAAAVNGSRKHVLRALFTWEAGMYRLANNVSPIPGS